MFEKEVDYRLAKWLLLNMEKDGIITVDELRLAWINIAGHYEPPFLEVENLDGKIGDGVIVDASKVGAEGGCVCEGFHRS